MSSKTDTEIKELDKLISINKDACSFYQNAREEVKLPEIKDTFSKLESLHNDVVINLQNYITAAGGKPDGHETFTGKTAQFWAELMAKISNDVDETFVTHLEEAEDRCLHSMEEAVKEKDMRPETKLALQGEMQTLRKTHDYMKALKDAMKAA